MALTVAELNAKLVMDTSGFASGAKQAADQVTTLEGRLKTLGSSMESMGKNLSLKVTAPIGVAFAFATKAMIDAEKQTALTEAHIKSTGGVANVTAGHVDEMAGSLGKLSGVSKENIQSGENMLLTFTNVKNGVGAGNQVFDDATKTILDMSVSLGEDSTAAAMQLGKALQDPIKGVTALRRVGVQLTDAQKDQIEAMVKSGDVMGAQKVILGELKTEFGGAAEAAGKTFGGQLGVMHQSLKDAAMTMEQHAVPAMTLLTHGVTAAADAFSHAPGFIQATVGGLLAVAAAAGPVLIFLGKASTGLSVLSGWWAKHTADEEEAAVAAEQTATVEEQLVAALEGLQGVLATLSESLSAHAGLAEGAATATEGLAGAADVAAGSLEAEGAAADMLVGSMEGATAATEELAAAEGSLAGSSAGVVAGALAGEGALAAEGLQAEETAVAMAGASGAAGGTEAASAGLLASMGPLGIAVGVTAGAIALFGMNAETAKDKAKEFAEMSDPQMKEALKGVGESAKYLDEVAASMGDVSDAGELATEAMETTNNASSVFAEVLKTGNFALAQRMIAQGGDNDVTAEWKTKLDAAMASEQQANADRKESKQLIDGETAATLAHAEALKRENEAAAGRKTLADATLSAASAQDQMNDAIKSFGDGTDKSTAATAKHAKTQVDDALALKQVADADKAVQTATDAVTAAQEALDKAKAPATEQQLAEAVDRVAQARVHEDQATQAVAAAQKALDDLSGPAHEQALADAADKVTEARIGEARAHQAVVDVQQKASDIAQNIIKDQAEIANVLAGNTTHLSDFAKAIQSTFTQALDPLKRFKADTTITLKSVTDNLTGNIADFKAWQENLAKLAAGGHQQLAQELAKLGPSAAGAVADAVKSSGPELDKLTGLFTEQAGYLSNTYAVQAGKAMGDVGIDAQYLGGLQADLSKQNQALQGTSDDLTLAQIAERRSHEDVAKAVDNQNQLIADGLPGSQAAKTASDNLEAAKSAEHLAHLDVNSAVDAQNNLMNKTGPFADAVTTASKGLQTATDNLNATILAQSKAHQDYQGYLQGTGGDAQTAAGNHESLASKIDGVMSAITGSAGAFAAHALAVQGMADDADHAQQKNQFMADYLNNTVLPTLKQGSPLWTAVKNYADTLLGIPANIHTSITAEVHTPNISISPPVGGHPGMVSLPIMPAEKGGPAGPNIPRWVGEKGPELWWPATAGMIIPRPTGMQEGPSPALTRAMSATTEIHNHYAVDLSVEGHVFTEVDLVNFVHEGLKTKNRQSGTLGFN